MQLELGRVQEEDLAEGCCTVPLAFHNLVMLISNLREISEHRLYLALLAMSPGLEERLNTGSEQDLHYVADMV